CCCKIVKTRLLHYVRNKHMKARAAWLLRRNGLPTVSLHMNHVSFIGCCHRKKHRLLSAGCKRIHIAVLCLSRHLVKKGYEKIAAGKISACNIGTGCQKI